MTYDEKLEFLCRQLCEEIGVDPEAKSPKGWRAYDQFIGDWLLTEAFSKVKGKYWNNEEIEKARAAKQLVVLETERDNKV